MVHRELEEDAVRVGAVHAVPDLRRPALRERADDGVHFAVKLNPPHLAPEVLVGISQQKIFSQKGYSSRKYSASKVIPEQNIQSVGIFQYEIFSW